MTERNTRLSRGVRDAAYTDLVVRQTVGSVFHYGGLASPDLIPVGPELQPPASFATPESYMTVPGTGLAARGPNYIYVRTRTPAGVAADIRARLYCGLAPPTAMLWPDQVALLDTADGTPYAELEVARNKIGVTPSPFVTPADVALGSTIAGYVFTATHRTTLPTLDSVTGLRDFLSKTPAFAQRTTRVLPAGALSFEEQCTYEHRGGDALMMFELTWSHVPGTWTVALEGEHGIALPRTTARGSMGIGKQLTLSGDFTANLCWTLSGDQPCTAATRFRLLVSLVQADASLIPMGGREARAAPPTDTCTPRPIPTPRRNHER